MLLFSQQCSDIRVSLEASTGRFVTVCFKLVKAVHVTTPPSPWDLKRYVCLYRCQCLCYTYSTLSNPTTMCSLTSKSKIIEQLWGIMLLSWSWTSLETTNGLYDRWPLTPTWRLIHPLTDLVFNPTGYLAILLTRNAWLWNQFICW